jgi:integrase
MPITDATWSSYRDWSLASDHALATAAKSIRYLKFLEREHGLVLDPPLQRELAIEVLARGRDSGTKPQTLNSWIREINLWTEFNHLGWKLRYFRNRGTPVIRVPDEGMVRRLRLLTWDNAVVNARNRAIMAVLADQGPRRNEIIRMDLSDLTRSESGRPALVVRHGKGEKQRILFIDESTDDLLQRYVKLYRTPSDRTALFTGPRGRMSYAYLARVVTEAGRRIGAPWLSCHKLRHFVCDSLLDSGVSVPSVAQVLGHSKLETTALYRSKRLAKVRAEQEIRGTSKARFGRRRSSS